ncbi:MAG: Cell division transporter, ATP-binding protein FtsE [Hydrogenibacillus schlegelii]|uniref:Cell division ATP-binding protein FtsE n=1 Tax=Hydrogenibacillus schlegelii TaxID=1484 RepID=A0A2T5GDH4_HYDSH|nr:MAG: Cell division transporter, ATP-binding protein FtsE [Hydrogenibacillus schlegelii]
MPLLPRRDGRRVFRGAALTGSPAGGVGAGLRTPHRPRTVGTSGDFCPVFFCRSGRTASSFHAIIDPATYENSTVFSREITRRIRSSKECLPLIEMDSVTKAYRNGVVALRDVTLSIKAGEFVYLTGPSGAGKSTWLKLVYREERPTKGTIKVGGFDLTKLKARQVPELRRSVGVVFQDYRLIDRLTVAENIAFALEVLELPEREIRRRVAELLDLVGLEAHARRFPRELSGGEQQRVAIARALAPKPKLLIADEPTGNLDEETAASIVRLLMEINAFGTTVVMATHDRALIERFPRRTIRLEGGRVAYDRPARQVREAVGR